MTGIASYRQGTLVDRALQHLATGPADSTNLTNKVLGIPMATPVVAERLVAALLGADPRVGRLGDGRWMLVAPSSSSPNLSDLAFVVVDLETTGGMSTQGDRITE